MRVDCVALRDEFSAARLGAVTLAPSKTRKSGALNPGKSCNHTLLFSTGLFCYGKKWSVSLCKCKNRGNVVDACVRMQIIVCMHSNCFFRELNTPFQDSKLSNREPREESTGAPRLRKQLPPACKSQGHKFTYRTVCSTAVRRR